MAIGLQSLLHLLGHLQPLLPGAWHLAAVGEKPDHRRIVVLSDPIDPDGRRRLVLCVGHGVRRGY
jgi:hypothetical protein